GAAASPSRRSGRGFTSAWGCTSPSSRRRSSPPICFSSCGWRRSGIHRRPGITGLIAGRGAPSVFLLGQYIEIGDLAIVEGHREQLLAGGDPVAPLGLLHIGVDRLGAEAEQLRRGGVALPLGAEDQAFALTVAQLQAGEDGPVALAAEA